jgi:hypothetical protein
MDPGMIKHMNINKIKCDEEKKRRELIYQRIEIELQKLSEIQAQIESREKKLSIDYINEQNKN